MKKIYRCSMEAAFEPYLFVGGIGQLVWKSFIGRKPKDNGQNWTLVMPTHGYLPRINESNVVQHLTTFHYSISMDLDRSVWPEEVSGDHEIETKVYEVTVQGYRVLMFSNDFLDSFSASLYPPFSIQGKDVHFYKQIVFQMDLFHYFKNIKESSIIHLEDAGLSFLSTPLLKSLTNHRVIVGLHDAKLWENSFSEKTVNSLLKPFGLSLQVHRNGSRNDVECLNYDKSLPKSFTDEEWKSILGSLFSHDDSIFFTNIHELKENGYWTRRNLSTEEQNRFDWILNSIDTSRFDEVASWEKYQSSVIPFHSLLGRADKFTTDSVGHLEHLKSFEGSPYQTLYRKDFTESLGKDVRSGKFVPVPLGLSEEWYRETEEVPGNCTFRVFHNARWDPYHKGQYELIRAIEAVLNRGSNLKFFLSMVTREKINFPLLEELKGKFPDQFEYTFEYLSVVEIKKIIKESDFVISPSKNGMEGFNLSVGEAMCLGAIPILSSQKSLMHWFEELPSEKHRLPEVYGNSSNEILQKSIEISLEYFEQLESEEIAVLKKKSQETAQKYSLSKYTKRLVDLYDSIEY